MVVVLCVASSASNRKGVKMSLLVKYASDTIPHTKMLSQTKFFFHFHLSKYNMRIKSNDSHNITHTEMHC